MLKTELFKIQLELSFDVAKHLQAMVATQTDKCMTCELLLRQIGEEIKRNFRENHNRVKRAEIKKNKYTYRLPTGKP